jgi:RNA recognition motif-containing protein
LDVKIIRKNVSGTQFKETNYGFIHMRNPEEADFALNNFNQVSKKPWMISTYNEKPKLVMKPPMMSSMFASMQEPIIK